MSDAPSAGQYYMDLGDFVPETYELRFSINGNVYVFQYGEATTDEVLTLLWQAQEEKKTGMEAQRQMATAFLKNHLAKGPAESLEADLAAVPFKSTRGGLDISSIVQKIGDRVKKNEPGATDTTPTA